MKNLIKALYMAGGMLLLLFLAYPSEAAAQTAQDGTPILLADTAENQRITLIDGSDIYGRVVKIDEKEIIFASLLGDLTIPIAKIKTIVSSILSRQDHSPDPVYKAEPSPEAEAITTVDQPPKRAPQSPKWWPNPNRTRLYFAPTGRMLKRGEGYFSDHYLLFPGIAIGVTDNLTLGAGMSIVPGIGFGEQVFFFTPKLGVAASENASFAVGALILKLPEDEPSAGILYGVSTFGSLDKSFTLGIGYGFFDGELADKPAIVAGADIRLSSRLAFVTENYILPDVDDPVVSYGMRFFGEKLSVDLALVNILGEDAIYPGIPYIDFVYNF